MPMMVMIWVAAIVIAIISIMRIVSIIGIITAIVGKITIKAPVVKRIIKPRIIISEIG